jgi:hypothetical protein
VTPHHTDHAARETSTMDDRPITFGINVNTRCSVIYPDAYPPMKLLELAERVEDLGYDSVIVGDNYFSKPASKRPPRLRRSPPGRIGSSWRPPR